MTRNIQTTSASSARSIYTTTTIDSSTPKKEPVESTRPGGSDTFIRNSPSRRVVRPVHARHPPLTRAATAGTATTAATTTCMQPRSTAALSTAAWRKAADDSVPLQVFSLVHDGQLAAAKTLMRAYKMSPDARLGQLGLDEVLEAAMLRSGAQPRDAVRFREFLSELRSAGGEMPVPEPADTALPNTENTHAVRHGAGRVKHAPVAVPSPFIAISPRPTGVRPSRADAEVSASAGHARESRAPQEPTAPSPRREQRTTAAARSNWRGATDNLADANGDIERLDPERGEDSPPAVYDQYDPQSSRLYRARRRCVDPGLSVVVPALKKTWDGVCWVYKVLFVSCSIGEPTEPKPPPLRRWERAGFE